MFKAKRGNSTASNTTVTTKGGHSSKTKPSSSSSLASASASSAALTDAETQRRLKLSAVAAVLGDDYAGHEEAAVWHALQKCGFDTAKCIDVLLATAAEVNSAAAAVFQMDDDVDPAAQQSAVAAAKRDRLKASLSAFQAVTPKRDGPAEFDFSSLVPASAASAAAPSAALLTTPSEQPRLKSSGGSASGRADSARRAERIRTPAKQKELEALLVSDKSGTAESGGKQHINLVVIGHVDAGKSTINGHLLLLTGRIDQRVVHKHERDAKAAGKGSFALAWALDEHDEERARGVTITVGINYFETARRHVTLLDAPGHRDFVPNMICGTAQADFAILVLDAAVGQFEVGFSSDGQTKEHALLARSLGACHLIVAINKMDSIGWQRERYDAIRDAVTPFLKATGFRNEQVTFLPCSGLTGANLSKRVAGAEPAAAWYTGPTLLEAIDAVTLPDRDAAELTKPLRFSVTDVYRSQALGLAAGGRVESGVVMVGDRVLVAPLNEMATVKAIHQREKAVQMARVGENVDLGLAALTGAAAAADALAPGDVICDSSQAVPQARRIRAQVLTFMTGADPILKGYSCDFLMQSLAQPCKVSRLLSLIDRATGEVKKNKPRLLGENVTAVIEIKFARNICIEKFADCKTLGRFTLRKGGKTVCAGVVLDIDESVVVSKSLDLSGGKDEEVLETGGE
jgi:elongation factor 1 alpha-like protein